jgi:hypothetical protein
VLMESPVQSGLPVSQVQAAKTRHSGLSDQLDLYCEDCNGAKAMHDRSCAA